MKKELMRCPDGTYLEIGVMEMSELEALRDSKFKNACKKIWVCTRDFIRKGIEFQVRILKALKLQIESLKK